MKWKCIIIDDEPVARKILEEYVADVDFLELVGKAQNPLKAAALLASSKIDLMFLDINMPRMNGIEFLKTSDSLPPAVMTTAYSEYAIESFALDVVDYLVKPFAFERFLKACKKAGDFLGLVQSAERIQKVPEDYFFVKHNGFIEKVMFDELLWIEAKQNYVVLHTDSRKMIVYITLKGILQQLPEEQFLKIHKSTIVNLSKIKSIQGNVVCVGTAKAIISQNLYDSVMKSILKDRLIKR